MKRTPIKGIIEETRLATRPASGWTFED